MVNRKAQPTRHAPRTPRRQETRRGFIKAASGTLGAIGGVALLPGVSAAAPALQGSEVIKIVTALPMTGSGYGQTITIVNAVRMAIEEVERKVGPFVIEFEAWDDATASAGKWDPGKVAELANRAASDPNIMVYIGHFNSGAAKISIPVLNQADLVMISPANTYPGLTKPGKGDPGEPEVYFPSGKRNYSRVVPADDLQGGVGALFAQKLGARTAYVLDDTELYGKGIADVFVSVGQRLGMRVAGRDGINGRAADYRAIATKIRATRPDVIYFGGITQNNAGKLVKDIRDAGVNAPFIGPDGIQERAFLDDAGDDAEGVYTTFGGLPVTAYTDAPAEWAARYKAFTNTEPGEPYAIYGYEAARVALAAIERAGVKDRDAIRAAVLGTRDFTGVLGGAWSFDDNGDTSLTKMSVSVAKRGAGGLLTWDLVEVLEAPA